MTTDLKELCDIQSEMRFIGSLFLNNDLFLEYDKVVRWDYYFSDPVCKTLYQWLEDLYVKEQKFNEKNITIHASQKEERVSFFRMIGGYKVIEDFMSISDESEFKSYFNAIQKWTLVRELELKGIDTTILRSSKNFEKANSNQIYNQIKKMLDGVHTKVTADVEVVSLTSGAENMVDGFLEKPDFGVSTFMESFNQDFRGWRDGTMFAFGTVTNGGKSRFMIKNAAYHSIIQKQKVLLMLNEMRPHEMKLAMLVTCVNNVEFQKVHGIENNINEKDLSLGLYFDEDGKYIYRKSDKEGNFIETVPEFKKRLIKISKQYRDVILVSKWIEENIKDDLLSVIDVAGDYSDSTLETIARKSARKGYRMIGFDNLKANKEFQDYTSLIRTTTVLSEVAKTENIFVWASIQETPDALRTEPMEISSMNIASAKGLKDVLDMLVLTREIEKETYGKYKYIPTLSNGFGESSRMPLPLNDRGHNWKIYSFVIDKNRAGSKEILSVSVNLNTNEWYENGILTR
jgi:galactitol-specific phosphotransferase system IIB component